MTRGQKLALAVLIVAMAAGVAVQWGPISELLQPATAPKKEAEKKAPKPYRFDAAKTRNLFAERTSTTADKRAAPDGAAYAHADVRLIRDEALSALLDGVHGGKPDGLVLTATVTQDGRSLPTMPLLVASRTKDGAVKIGFELTGDAPKPMSPAFAIAGGATISLSVAYLEGAAADEAAIAAAEVAQAMDRVPLWPGAEPTAPAAQIFVQAAGSFAQRFLIGAVSRIDPLLVIDVGAAGTADLAAKDAGGATTPLLGISLATHTPMLAEKADYAAAVGTNLGPGIGIGADLMAHPREAAAVILAEDTDLPAACRALSEGLQRRLGLAAVDAGRTIDAIAAARRRLGTFAALGCDGAAAAKKSDFTDGAAMNRAIDRIAGAFRAAKPERAPDRLAPALAPVLSIADFSRFWLPGAEDGVIAGPAHILPAVSRAAAADLLAALPVRHIGCYNTGRRASGHRATLLELEGDSGLWLLDMGFDGDGKIDALTLRPALQTDACRAVGGRASGADACYFATAGRTFRGIDPGRCR